MKRLSQTQTRNTFDGGLAIIILIIISLLIMLFYLLLFIDHKFCPVLFKNHTVSKNSIQTCYLSWVNNCILNSSFTFSGKSWMHQTWWYRQDNIKNIDKEKWKIELIPILPLPALIITSNVYTSLDVLIYAVLPRLVYLVKWKYIKVTSSFYFKFK